MDYILFFKRNFSPLLNLYNNFLDQIWTKLLNVLSTKRIFSVAFWIESNSFTTIEFFLILHKIFFCEQLSTQCIEWGQISHTSQLGGGEEEAFPFEIKMWILPYALMYGIFIMLTLIVLSRERIMWWIFGK